MQADVRTTCSSPVRNRLMRSATLPPVPVAAPPGSQFRVISDYRPGKNMDLAAHRGELVEVIKKQDPMGSDQRWFVRRNGEQGFLPKEILVPTITSRLPAPAPAPPVPWRRTTETNETEDESESTLHENVRLAGFDFLPNGPHQLPLTVGDEVSVLRQHDLDGNSEWWYVQNRHGTRGYVPSAYLKKPT
jgi:Variant SH3 domain